MNRFFLFTLILFSFVLFCRTESPRKEKPIPLIHQNFEGCGECLDLDTGRVCTTEGTYYNSCLAICKRVKILCDGECPCPVKE
ncbi:MAG: hypothetical protein NZ853_07160 [Leptospiraceae bacterium]|nr:hypothetical protein [Leptospiraceae bacterium]MDW7975788.1 hypothetical protein [Leptospiraceae bacterium]